MVANLQHERQVKAPLLEFILIIMIQKLMIQK